MLVCQCNAASVADIERIVVELLDDDPWQLIVPAIVFRALETRGKCYGCLPNVVGIIISAVERYHADLETADDKVIDLTRRLAGIGGKLERKRQARHASRRQKQPIDLPISGTGLAPVPHLPSSDLSLRRKQAS